jgi:hypothetical protein
MCYTDAPACDLLATHCAACGRPLVDAVSVETGIGPVCRERYMVADCASDQDRARANALVHLVAAIQKDHGRRPELLDAIREVKALGFWALAEKLEARAGNTPVRLEMTTDERGREFLVVAAPYLEAALGDWNKLSRWDRELKARVVPAHRRADLWALLRRWFAGLEATGPKGPFVIEGTD